MWPLSVPDATPLTLAELASQIEETVGRHFPDDVWVTAEIASFKRNPTNGHCYLDLADDGAHLRGCLWRSNFARINARFAGATGSDLQAGQHVLLRAAVRFHHRWGLSLDVHDVDPAFTLGQAALRRRETFLRLEKEGWTQMNRTRPLPLVPQRVAVVSSATAEGYRDFTTLLHHHPAGYAFRTTLFPALMQGAQAPVSVAAALADVAVRAAQFDVVAVLRGGGSTLDLACFDDYGLAVQAATLPLPLLTGIGHEGDTSALDAVAHTRCAVPREAAHFLLQRAEAFDGYLGQLAERLRTSVRRQGQHRGARLHALDQRLALATTRATQRHAGQLGEDEQRLARATTQTVRQHAHALDVDALRLRALDPELLWQRGYTLTTLEGRRLTRVAAARPGQTLRTWLPDGTIDSTIHQTHPTDTP